MKIGKKQDKDNTATMKRKAKVTEYINEKAYPRKIESRDKTEKRGKAR